MEYYGILHVASFVSSNSFVGAPTDGPRDAAARWAGAPFLAVASLGGSEDWCVIDSG